MMGDGNVFLLEHPELTSFLQKELTTNGVDMELTDHEKSILLGVIKRTIISHGLASVPNCPRSLLKQSTSSNSESQDEEDPYLQLQTDYVTSKGDGTYVDLTNINSERRHSTSTTYFKFCNTNLKDISTHNYLIRSSSISNDYITPLSPSPTRYEQVTINRIKQHFGDLNQITAINKKVSYLEVIHPVTEDSDKTEINTQYSLCDFLFSICGYACFLGCRNNRKHKKNNHKS